MERENQAFIPEQALVDIVTSVGARKKLNQSVLGMTTDPEGVIHFGLIRLRVIDDENNITKVGAQILGGTLFTVKRENITSVITNLLKNSPQLSIICDNEIAQSIAGEATTWLEEDHYQLQGFGSAGLVDVFTPYQFEEEEEGVRKYLD